MNYLAVLTAGLVYFMLGGLWFTPLFGKFWDRSIGFERPEKWRPTPAYYIGPLVGCLIASLSTAFLLHFIQPASLGKALMIGGILGLGYGATITSVNAISPAIRKPALFSLVTGSYHALGLTICAAILHLWR